MFTAGGVQYTTPLFNQPVPNPLEQREINQRIKWPLDPTGTGTVAGGFTMNVGSGPVGVSMS